jgi:hypothetical protein
MAARVKKLTPLPTSVSGLPPDLATNKDHYLYGAPKELTDSIPVDVPHLTRIAKMPRKKAPDLTPEKIVERSVDQVLDVIAPPKFSDFDGISVPLASVRIELAALQKEGLEYIPLSDFLLLVHRCVKENHG